MEITRNRPPGAPAELREAARCLSGTECSAIAADLAQRGLAATPTYSAWLHTELLKAAQRKRMQVGAVSV